MARVVSLSYEFKRRGAGSFVSKLGDEYLVVANERSADGSFIVMRIKPFVEVVSSQTIKDDLNQTYESIKEKVSLEMKRKRSNRVKND